MKKTNIIKLALFLSSLLISFTLAEIGYRIILFKSGPEFNKLRKPNYFADYFSEDDYWKLYYQFDGQHKPPQQPHPELGWVGDFSRDSYKHNQIEHIGKRRPVLLYGDSFANCIKEVYCFEDLLNSDQTFSKEHYLLNYGVGGYGVGQIFLLFQKSIHNYDNPFVVISFMTFDLDRSILSVRTGQKPYYLIKDNELELNGTPINPIPDDFFTANPPQIKSYLYRKIVYSRHIPKQIAPFLKRTNDYISKKKQVNEKIILEIVKELKTNNIDYVFLVFHPHWYGVSTLNDEANWRDSFLKRVFHENNIPYIWSKDIFQQDSKDRPFSYDDYIIPGNGHPTTYFNKLISDEIKKYTLE